MPNIIITEADFEKLSDDTKKELWELLQGSFQQKGTSNDGSETKSRDNIEDINPASFDLLSIETAIAVMVGLSEESLKVVEALCERELTRDDLTKILGNKKKINGTIGSINRRLAKRLNENRYGKQRDRVKLITFDGNYRLSCNSRALEFALLLIRKGYKIGEGDIVLKYKKFPKLGHGSEILIKEEAIVQIDSGEAIVHFVSWDQPLSDDYTNNLLFYVIGSTGTDLDKIVVSTYNDDEWEPNSFSGGDYPFGDPDEIFIGGKKRR